MDPLPTLGFSLPSPAYLFGAIFFGLIGLAAFRSGRRQKRPRLWGIGLALMLYPYVVSRPWLVWTVGTALCVGLWLDRE